MEIRIRLLLIEDSPADAALILRSLEKSKETLFSVDHQTTMRSGLESLHNQLPDIVLLDMNLPDSFGVNSIIKITEAGFSVPIVVMSGNLSEDLELAAIKFGAQDHFEKSNENYALLSRILRLSFERYQTVTALQKSEARYRMISEISSDYMFNAHVEADGTVIQDWTAGAIEQTTGYTLDEYLTNGGWSAIVHPEDRWLDQRDMETMHRNEEVESELRIIKKDGSTAWVQVKAIPVWDEDENRLVHIFGSTLDITERKINQSALQKSELRFKTMFDEASLGIGLTEARTGEYRQLNKRFCEMVGRPLEELLTMTWIEITHPDDIDLDLEQMKRLNAGEIDSFQIEKRYFHSDGSIIWVNMKVTPIAISGSDGDYVMSMVEDITKKKQQEQELIASENRFRLLYEHAPIAISLSNSATGQFLQVNQQYANLVDYSQEYLESTNWKEITHPDDIALDIRQMELLNAGTIGEFQMEKRYIHANGNVVWVNMHIAPLPISVSGDADKNHLCMVEDITERKQHQLRLEESENRFRLLYEQAPSPYQSLNEDGMLLEINDAWLEELGYERNEVIGQYFANFISDKDAERFPQNFKQFKEMGEVHGVEYQMLRKDQNLIDVNFDGKIVRDPHGNFIQTHCVFTNITERKRLQDALESRIVALTRPLEQTGELTLPDLFDLDQLQQIQDEFSDATNVASIITQPDGTPITKPSNFCRLCNDIIRSTEQGRSNCFKSDAALGGFNPEGPTVFPCLSAGLWDAGASITVGGQHIANWLIGQVRDDTQNESDLRSYAKEIGADEDEVIEAFHEVPIMSKSQFSEVSQMLFTLSKQLSNMAYQNIQQARFITEQKQAEYEKERNLSRLESLAAILQYPYENKKDFLDFALEEAIQLTSSKIGYIYLFDEETGEFELNTWSKEVLAECRVAEPHRVYALEKTGIWGEAVRQRKTIMVNDFQAPHPKKKGYPDGHVHMVNFLTVPVFSDNKIVAVVGVANKETDYDHHDELQLTLLMNNVWKVVERGQMMQELAAVNQRLEHYIESSDIMLHAYDLLDPSFHPKWQSENSLNLIGYTLEEINQPDWWDQHRLSDDVITLEDIAKMDISGKDTIEQDYPLRHKNGDTVWINERIKLIFNASGKPVEAIAAWTDITNRKRMLEDLRQSTEDLNKAQSVANVGSWKWHIPTNQLTWSDEMYTIFGINKEDFTGHLPEVTTNGEYRIIQPDQSIRIVWAEAGELVTDEDGNPIELTGVVQDITERKAVEEQLLLQDTALNAAANSIVITDREGIIQWANPAFSELTGYTIEEAAGKNPRDLVKSGLHDDFFYQQMWDTVLNGDTWLGELINRRKDGTNYSEQMTITPILDHEGEVTNFIAIKEDISLRKQQEARIQQHLKIQEKLVLMGRAFSSLIDIQMIYRTAYRHISEIMEIPNMGITLYDVEDQSLERVFAVNDGIVIDVSQFSNLPHTPETTTTSRSKVIVEQKALITNELQQKIKEKGSIFINTTAQKPQSAIYVPLLDKHMVLGVIELQSYEKNVFTQETIEWLSVVANQIALAIQNARLYEQIRERVSQLAGLREIDTAINGHNAMEFIYQIVLNQIRFHIKSDAADILLLDDQKSALNYQAGYGFQHIDTEQTKIPLGYGLSGTVVESGKQIIHNGSDMFDLVLEKCEKWTNESFTSYIGIPINFGNETMGVLEIFHRTKLSPRPEWLQYLQTLAGQVAIALDNTELIGNLKQTAENLTQAYDATIEGWSQAMDLRDKETEGHTKRVTELSVKLAAAAGYPQEKMDHIRRGALLHDIGKLGVPDYILRKPGKLDAEEWELMKQHPVFAYDMLKQVDYLKPALDIPLYHHERWDGSGYPEGLAGEDIPLSARIFAFVDVWDAVTNDRPYKKAWSEEKALALIRNGSGTHFDPYLAKLFIDIITTKPEDSE